MLDQFTAQLLYRDVLPARVWAKIDIRDPDSCWPWTAALNNYGYPNVYGSGHTLSAARWVWHVTVGPIPPDHVLVRKCSNKQCMNWVHHLEAVTWSDMHKLAGSLAVYD